MSSPTRIFKFPNLRLIRREIRSGERFVPARDSTIPARDSTIPARDSTIPARFDDFNDFPGEI
ncbi:hypothetical protein F2Q68_00024707 [Brassica cretica]|uniref:Uncharacterized protein n=1 Tax=Brassica cretica TaxID=69181 RepID=A0A8S9IHV4_BRACR|nr:hypothetical protein F2Q68_00024707 [Brassica cretica]